MQFDWGLTTRDWKLTPIEMSPLEPDPADTGEGSAAPASLPGRSAPSLELSE